MRVAVLLAHVTLNVFNDDNGIVHHQSGCENDSKERQSVDREVQQLDKREGADQGNGNSDRGNQRTAPVLEKDQHHQHDKENRFRQRLHHFADGVAHEGRRVKGDGVLQSGGKSFRETRQLLTDGLVHVESVGLGNWVTPMPTPS